MQVANRREVHRAGEGSGDAPNGDDGTDESGVAETGASGDGGGAVTGRRLRGSRGAAAAASNAFSRHGSRASAASSAFDESAARRTARSIAGVAAPDATKALTAAAHWSCSLRAASLRSQSVRFRARRSDVCGGGGGASNSMRYDRARAAAEISPATRHLRSSAAQIAASARTPASAAVASSAAAEASSGVCFSSINNASPSARPRAAWRWNRDNALP